MPEQKAGILLNWTEQTLAEVFSDFPVSEESAEESRGLVQNLVELMVTQPQSLAALLRLVSHGDYLYYHSVAVSIFSALIARASGKYSDDDVKLISWGGVSARYRHEPNAQAVDLRSAAGDGLCAY